MPGATTGLIAMAPWASKGRHVTEMQQPVRNFDQQALVLTFCVWAFHLVINGTLFNLVPGFPHGWDVQFARMLCSLLAGGLCLLAHLFLRRSREVTLDFMAIVLTSMVPLALVQTWLSAWIFHALANAGRPQWSTAGGLAMDYIGYQWMFLTWAALYVGLSHALEARVQQARLAKAERQAQQAQLAALRLQINPQFLFNTLNTIAGLVALGRKEETETTLQSLSQFLRYTLAGAPTQFATVADEIGMLQRYLRIEQTRFSDRLHVHYRVDADSARAMLPSLALLPLVENAIKHGLGESEHGITIEIGAHRDNDRLLVWVENGADGEATRRDGLGIGLENVRQRLAVLFGDEASLEAQPVPGGWRASLRLPWMVEAT